MSRRIVLIFMILALPIQASWVAAASYCGHESGFSARHFGHHDHTHSTSGSEKSKTQSACDSDCSFHSHSNFQGVTADGISLDTLSSGDVLNATGALFHPHSVFYRPDRPKWLAAVPAASTGREASQLI
jgi:hypothetical protein